jgi:hypothetical protein
MLDARTWIHAKLTNHVGVQSVLGSRIFSALGIDPGSTPDEKPFAVIRLGNVPRAMPEGGTTIDATIWVHGEPVGYTDIDEAIEQIKLALEGPITSEPDGIQADWTGDSADLQDDARQTNVRTTSFRLAARR